jgi:RNA-directed DNA polymerase
LTRELLASGTGLERDQAEVGVFPAEERTERTNPLERGSESISDLVFGTGSLSASVVLLTLGNAAHVDPDEESGAPLYRIVF